jgi:hypothetical protein
MAVAAKPMTTWPVAVHDVGAMRRCAKTRWPRGTRRSAHAALPLPR